MADYDDSLVTVSINSGINLKLDEPAGQDSNQNLEKVSPILVEESTFLELPQNLDEIFEGFSKNGGNLGDKFDLLVPLIYVLLIESGFEPKNLKNSENSENPKNSENSENSKNSENSENLKNNEFLGKLENFFGSLEFCRGRIRFYNFLPENWKNRESGSYFFEMGAREKFFKIILTPNQCFLNVNVIFDSDILTVFGINVNRYVMSPVITPHGANMAPKFKNLRELSKNFKNEISQKIKIELFSDTFLLPTLQHMPFEILFKISKSLFKISDFSNLISSSQKFRDFENLFRDSIWKFFYLRDFGTPNEMAPNPQNLDWKENYKKAFQKKKKIESFSEIKFCLR